MINFDSLSDDELNEEIAARKGVNPFYHRPLPPEIGRFAGLFVRQWVRRDYLHDGAATWEALTEMLTLPCMSFRPTGGEIALTWFYDYPARTTGYMGAADANPARTVWIAWLMWKEQQAWQRLR